MPKYTKKSKIIHLKLTRKIETYFLDRAAARNALSKPPARTAAGADDNMLVDDVMSVCSNVSDATSIYDDVEGTEIEKIWCE